jgi:hypothetical protein
MDNFLPDLMTKEITFILFYTIERTTEYQSTESTTTDMTTTTTTNVIVSMTTLPSNNTNNTGSNKNVDI